jgi:hypothetical protein
MQESKVRTDQEIGWHASAAPSLFGGTRTGRPRGWELREAFESFLFRCCLLLLIGGKAYFCVCCKTLFLRLTATAHFH